MKSSLRTNLHRLESALAVVAMMGIAVACTDSSITGLPAVSTPIVAPTTASIAPSPIALSNSTRQGDTGAGGASGGKQGPTEHPTEDATAIPTSLTTPAAEILVGAGDIASCDSDADEKTASLLDRIAGTVFTLGDNVYDDGKASEFKECYEPTWGRHKARTRPASGNHDYRADAAKPYFDYFGEAAGDPQEGWYSYDLGGWHVVVLNSNCAAVGGCGPDSEQVRWLRDDLAAHPVACTLGYWHHPRFSAGKYEDNDELRPFWQALYDAGADVVMGGHDHNYQRYAPQNPDGAADESMGIRQFVVGTGGKSFYDIKRSHANLEVSRDDTHGVLKLTLMAGSYAWEFIPVQGESFTDSGSDVCH